MKQTVQVFELLRRRILVSRESARAIEPHVAAALAEGPGELILDLSGVEGLSPSFLDETLLVVEKHLPDAGQDRLRVTIENPPTQLSSKFAAVGRGHGLTIEESAPGVWTIYKTRGES